MSDPAPQSRSSLLLRGLAGPLDRNPLFLILVSLAWALLWMGLEVLFQRRGVGSPLQALAPLGLCGAGAAILLLAAPAHGRRWFTAPALAAALVLVLLAALGAGWMVVRARAGEVTPGGDLAWPLSLLRTMRVADLFRSLWLEAMLLPLAVMSLTLLWTRRREPGWRLGRDGARLLVLAAPVLLAAASLWNRAAGERAVQVLSAGETQGAFEGLRPGGGTLLLPGFRIRMDRLEATPREPAFRLVAQAGPGAEARPWSTPVEPGQTGSLPGGLRYQVERLIPDGVPSGQVVEDPQAPLNPAVQVLLGLGDAEPLVGVLFAHDPELWRRDEPQGRFAVLYRDRFEPAFLKDLRPHPPLRQKLALTFMGRTLEHPVRVGDTWRLPGFSLTVTAVYPDFGGLRTGPGGRREFFSRSPLFLNPWVEVQLRQASGGEAPLLLSANPVPGKDYADYLARTLPPGMTLRYVPEGQEIQRRFVLLTRDDGKVRLVQDGQVVRTEEMALNHPFLVEKGLSVTPLAKYERARFDPDFVPDPEADGSNPFAHPVMRLRVWDPATGVAESRWLEARGPAGRPVGAAFLGGRIRLVYRPKTPDLRDLRAALAVTDPEGAVRAQGVVASGAPLVFHGFRFYLDGWVAGPPPAGRLLLATDPGLGLGWAGLACLAAGAVWLLLPGGRRGSTGVAEEPGPDASRG